MNRWQLVLWIGVKLVLLAWLLAHLAGERSVVVYQQF